MNEPDGHEKSERDEATFADVNVEAPRMSRRRRRVIAIGGGRGGVGKSLLAVNLGVYFAQLGREVALLDLNPDGSSIHKSLGIELPPLVTLEAMREGQGEPVRTSVPGLCLLPTAYDPLSGAPQRMTRAREWRRQIESLHVDYVIVNLGATSSAPALDIFLEADVPISVTTPDPSAIDSFYRFIRALFFRKMRRTFFKDRFKEKLIAKSEENVDAFITPREYIDNLRRFDERVAQAVLEILLSLRPSFVVSQTRAKTDTELGPMMERSAWRFLGVQLEYLGHVEFDDAVWLTSRAGHPLLIDSPTSKSARNIERIARRILAMLLSLEARTGAGESAATQATFEAEPRTLYDVLGVSRAAADDEIRRAYKQQKEIYREGSLPIVSIVPAEGLKRERARTEEAYDTLLDPVKRRAYDASVFPEADPEEPAVKERYVDASDETRMLRLSLARELTDDTEFTGALLRRVRESQGVELSDISKHTKIAVSHLRAIEAENSEELPALVYVKGFVGQVAKFLRLNPDHVVKTYIRRLRHP